MIKRQALLLTGLLGIGVALGATIVSTSHQPDKSSSFDDSRAKLKASLDQQNITSTTASDTVPSETAMESGISSLDQLRNELKQEIESRKKLENKVAILEKLLNTSSSTGTSVPSETETSTSSPIQNPHEPGNSGAGFSTQSNDWFNEQAMLDAGIDPVKVNTIKQAFEQAEMDKLYLRDQATREGWMNTKRYTDSAKEIADRTRNLRNELNESEYDAYLYASGQSNRVIVSSTLSTSPASNAGIKPGDTILKYDNKRVYNWSDLTSATSEGSPSDTVSVTIERNGQLQQVYLPRGPLGIRLTTDSVAP